MNVEKYFKNRDDSSKAVCGVVFRTSLREFDVVKEFLKERSIYLIYQRTSLERLYVMTESELEDVKASGRDVPI